MEDAGIKELKEFQFNATKLTYSLFTLLQGMELVRSQYGWKYDAQRTWSAEEKRQNSWSTGLSVAPSYLDLNPQLMGVNDLDLIRQGGEVEQLAYRGWITGMFALWEKPSRSNMRKAHKAGFPDASNLILPEVDAMGDLRLIRNDISHNDAMASKGALNKCSVLKWFQAGERIILSTDHVLDFLNHMGILHQLVLIQENGSYTKGFGFSSHLNAHTNVRIVSLRMQPGVAKDSTEMLCLFRVVFSTGFYADLSYPTGLPSTDENWEYLYDVIAKTHITPDGNIEGPEAWICANASALYAHSVGTEDLRQKGELIPDFPVPEGGFPGPWMQFAKSP